MEIGIGIGTWDETGTWISGRHFGNDKLSPSPAGLKAWHFSIISCFPNTVSLLFTPVGLGSFRGINHQPADL
jgi:hypothetical protein